MNSKRILIASIVASLAMQSALLAATFSGTSADITDFENGSEVSTRGTLIDAINLINDDEPTADVTINGVLFKGIAPGQFHEAGESFAEASFVYHGGDGYQDVNLWTSGGAYDVLAESQLFSVDRYDVNYGDGYGVVNLAPGNLYELQILMLDDRSGVDKTYPLQFQQVTFTGVADGFVPYDLAPDDLGYIDGISIGGAGVTQANGEIATILFSIDEGFNGIFVNTWDNGAFNGMQLRFIGLVGDYDGNGSVGAEDYDVWKANYGSTSSAEADGNLDGIVDAADYTIWRDRATTVGVGAAALSAVPEPSAVMITLSAVLLFIDVTRLRRNSVR